VATGDKGVRDALADALSRPSADDVPTLTHAFHPWPARMHPKIASGLIEHFGDKRGDDEARVLDPFMGSGTVLIESMVHGHRSLGVDLNPLAVKVARVKCMRPDDDTIGRILTIAEGISEKSMERVRARQDVRAKLPKEMAANYEPHVLKELAGLIEEIHLVDDTLLKEALLVVFSAMVVKFSNRRADTSTDAVKKKIGRFMPSRFFVEKTRELTEQWRALRAAAVEGAPHPVVKEGDARALPDIVWGKVSRIITSPPYGGTYDYIAHHAERICWLGLDARHFRTGEIGSRRDFSSTALSKTEARARFDKQVKDVLVSMRGILADEGMAILLVGDGEVAGVRMRADQQIAALAPPLGYSVKGVASSSRPDFKGGAPRQEHLIALRAIAMPKTTVAVTTPEPSREAPPAAAPPRPRAPREASSGAPSRRRR
jgi:hypothetical protein